MNEISMNEIFKESFSINNKTIGVANMKDILKYKILIPNEQRMLDPAKVNDIKIYQDMYIKENNTFNFLGLINIHYCNEKGKYYLIDGQHRWAAMKVLYNDGYKNLEIRVELVIVECLEDMKNNYKIINKNTELPEFPDDIDKNVVENVCGAFFKEFPEIWSQRKRNIRPKLNKNNFQEGVAYLMLKLNENNNKNGDKQPQLDVEDLKKYISEKNNQMSKWPAESYEKKIRKIKKWPEYLRECEKNKFYLGMYNHTNEEYCYDWVKEIVETHTGDVLKKQPKINKKKKIPDKLRSNVWDKYNGKKTEAMCYCCNSPPKLHINSSWDCAHVKAESLGGNLSIDNLRPTCGNCNKTMGVTNLYDYMAKNFPENYKVKKPEKSTLTKIKNYIYSS